MKASIPAYSLSEIVKPVLENQSKKLEYFLASFVSPMQLSVFPHRASYYGIAVCTKGSAQLFADLEIYTLLPNSLIVMGPETIRSWKEQSVDYAEEILFFTESFFLKNMDYFAFFRNNVAKVTMLDNDSVYIFNKLFNAIKEISQSSSLRKDAIARNYIDIVLNHVADLYDKYYAIGSAMVNSQNKMVSDFKKLLIEKHLEIRTVNGYADLLNVTAKHLSETIKEVTGRTASEWIHNILILEAKVRLKQSMASIARIAEELNFSDASLFGKYFRRYTGYSPAAYRKGN